MFVSRETLHIPKSSIVSFLAHEYMVPYPSPYYRQLMSKQVVSLTLKPGQLLPKQKSVVFAQAYLPPVSSASSDPLIDFLHDWMPITGI